LFWDVEKDRMNTPSVAVVIITYDEEINLPYALRSVVGWAKQVFVVDSFSRDRTVEIARELGAETYQHAFETFGTQKNWALDNLPITAAWVLFLDADEYLSEEIKAEIPGAIENAAPDINGFVTGMRYIYLGRWLKHGDIYRKLIRLIRRGRASYIVTSAYHEKMVVHGGVARLNTDIVHDDHKPLREWIAKQMGRIEIDAHHRLESVGRPLASEGSGTPDSATIEGGRSIWLKKKLNCLPGPVRPFAQFFYRYVLRLGFLDGWPGFIYCFLFQFWYPLMVEVLYLEARARSDSGRLNSTREPQSSQRPISVP
jgi:glycosyltransferase involved in cell wall biosynthesis